MKTEIPSSPVFFLKPPSAILADGGTVVIPPISREMHHEVELTVLIGNGGHDIPPPSALAHVAGYGIGLDMTLRDVQSEAKNRGLPWTLAKGFDTSAPLSEFAPASSVGKPHNLTLKLSVNGAVRQQSSTDDMIFSVEELISFVSRFITLDRGDVIYTGTPQGVGSVQHGDQLEAELLNARNNLIATLKVQVG